MTLNKKITIIGTTIILFIVLTTTIVFGTNWPQSIKLIIVAAFVFMMVVLIKTVVTLLLDAMFPVVEGRKENLYEREDENKEFNY